VITNYRLASLNAILNGTALVCVLFGWRAIRQRRYLVHKRWMLSAFVLSVIFIVSYVSRIVLFGDTHFRGVGGVRYLYFALLISHVLLAVTIAPFVVYTVMLGLRDRRERHKRFAPKVLPVWIYVLATGVLVYLFLHQFFA
jgi:putative membrane protein